MTCADGILALFLTPVLGYAIAHLALTRRVQRFHARHAGCVGPCYSPRWYLSKEFRGWVFIRGWCGVAFALVAVVVYMAARK
jgi:hypothetical protein